VADKGQLASLGPGSVLRDLVACRRIPVTDDGAPCIKVRAVDVAKSTRDPASSTGHLAGRGEHRQLVELAVRVTSGVHAEQPALSHADTLYW